LLLRQRVGPMGACGGAGVRSATFPMGLDSCAPTPGCGGRW
jgi:hypothetical protein